jgi:hypothetical protein
MPMYVTLSREGATNDGVAVKVSSPPVAASTSRKAAAARPGPGNDEPASLSISFEPAQAMLYIDGMPKSGVSPFRIELAEGKHTVRVEAPGHVAVSKSLDLAAGNNYDMSVSLSREQRVGRVDIVSSPAGAQVLIDGDVKGTTPMMGLSLEPGREYTVAVRAAGYEGYSTKIVPVDGKKQSVSATLKAEPAKVASATPTPAPVAKAPAPAAAALVPPSSPSRVVPPNAVRKISGDLPRIETKKLPASGTVSSRLCIDEKGRVISNKLNAELPADVKRILLEAVNESRTSSRARRSRFASPWSSPSAPADNTMVA